MTIVHIHVEKTGGVTLQKLYEDKYGGSHMAHFLIRDGIFAPYSIHTANYTKNWQLKLYKAITTWLPNIKRMLVTRRNNRRRKQAISPEDLKKMKVVIGHVATAQMIPYLPVAEHQYRTIVREPLDRMWSHYRYWRGHKGDVGHRFAPPYDAKMTFEEFALLPALANYQTQATGTDPSIYEAIGTTEKLSAFARKTDLITQDKHAPILNHFDTEILPELSDEFIKKFEQLHADDYVFYEYAKSL